MTPIYGLKNGQIKSLLTLSSDVDQDAQMFCFSFYQGQIFAQDSVVLKTKLFSLHGGFLILALSPCYILIYMF